MIKLPTPSEMEQRWADPNTVTDEDQQALLKAIENLNPDWPSATIACTVFSSPHDALRNYLKQFGWALEYTPDQRDGDYYTIKKL